MISKLAASDDLKFYKWKYYQNVQVRTLLFHACNFCMTYNLISTMNHHSKTEDKNFPICELSLE